MAEKLSPAQRAALEDAGRGPLRRARHGWAINALNGHPTSTVEALARRGLLTIDRLAACAGEARITKAGKALLAELANG